MKSFRLLIGLLGLTTGACSPYIISYQHVSLAEENGLEILERSTPTKDPKADSLLLQEAAMPLRAILKRPTYVVEIYTPRNPVPVVFLNARSPDDAVLEIEGEHIHRTHPHAIGYTHSFYVREAHGKPLTFQVRGASGRVLGTESLRYEIRKRGIAYGLEFI